MCVLLKLMTTHTISRKCLKKNKKKTAVFSFYAKGKTLRAYNFIYCFHEKTHLWPCYLITEYQLRMLVFIGDRVTNWLRECTINRLLSYRKCNFPMNPHIGRPFFLICRSVHHNFLRREVTLPMRLGALNGYWWAIFSKHS